jgi:Alkaline phosphatase PhoX
MLHGQRTPKPRAGRRLVATMVAAATLAIAASPVTAAPPSTAIGPDTTTAPYVLPVPHDVKITSLLTVGDGGAASNGYELVGIPDGIGLARHDGKAIVYLNHELRDAQGIVRRHGATGSFVSHWVIDPKTLEVKAGSDLIDPRVRFWDYPNGMYVTTGARFADLAAQDPTFGRFCSGTLSDPGVFYDKRSGKGYTGQIYFANEEDGDNGRTFAVTTDGRAVAFPRIGLAGWENTIPAANRSSTTLVMGDEDGPSDGSQLRAYVGVKQSSGVPIVKAGLTDGLSYVIDAANAAVTDDAGWRATYGKGVAAPVTLANVPWSLPGALQNSLAKTDGLNLNRIEDGIWDPRHRNDFYFVTTEGGQTSGTGLDARDGGGLWRLRFHDIDRPFDGATLTLLLDGSESLGGSEPKFNKPDNLGIDRHGNLLIQEDPGGNNHLARIVAYRLKDGALGVVARFDEARFGPAAIGSPAFLTIDEESSGIVDGEAAFGKGTFLFDAQVHTAAGLPAGTGPGTVQEFVEHGQLLLLKVRDWDDVYGH